MKKWLITLISVLIFTSFTVAFIACEEEEDNNDSSNVDPPDYGDDHTAEGYEGEDDDDLTDDDDDDDEIIVYGKRKAPDPDAGDFFGMSVAIQGDYAIVGAPNDDLADENAGAAYIYHRTHGIWHEPTKINAFDSAPGDIFGYSVAIHGDYAIVGAPSAGSNSIGVAYIYHRIDTNSWIIQTKLVAPGYQSHFFGRTVSINSHYAIVGTASKGAISGAAYIYHKTGDSTWDGGTKIENPDGDAGSWDNHWFARSVDIEETDAGDYAVVGKSGRRWAPWEENIDGAVYIFRRTGTNAWDDVTKIEPFDGENGDLFGYAVAIDNGFLAVTRWYGEDISGNPSGSVYVYQRSGINDWNFEAKMFPPYDPAPGYDFEEFGESIDMEYPYMIVGALREDNLKGAAYLFEHQHSSTNPWKSYPRIVAFDRENYGAFGASVGISGDYALIGAPENSDHPQSSGAVYFYKFK